MPTPNPFRNSPVAGKASTESVRSLRIPPEDGLGAGMAAFFVGMAMEKHNFAAIAPFLAFDANAWTSTLGGTAAALARADGGMQLTPGSDGTKISNLRSIDIWATPGADQPISWVGRVTASDITQVGFSIGIGNSQTDPNTTAYTDFIGFHKEPTTGAIVGRVYGNGGSVAASATLATAVNNIGVKLGFIANLHATKPWGTWFVGGVATPFTSAQLTALAAILTSPPSMYHQINAKGNSGNPNLLVQVAMLQIDNRDTD